MHVLRVFLHAYAVIRMKFAQLAVRPRCEMSDTKGGFLATHAQTKRQKQEKIKKEETNPHSYIKTKQNKTNKKEIL